MMKVARDYVVQLLLLLSLLASSVVYGAVGVSEQLHLAAARSMGGNVFELTGLFGSDCARCEVIADYGGKFQYAYRPKHWQANRIELQIDDINRELDVELRVVTAQGTTKPHRVRLTRKITPAIELQQPVPTGKLDTVHYFERSHQLALGNKGEDSFDVSVAPPNCGQQAQVFEQARIVYGQQRFAQAQVVQSPVAGCVHCSPLKVRWYNEPTGKLTYQLHIYRRHVSGICPAQVRG